MININNKSYREVRCFHCRKLICYEYIFAGRIGFHCPRCDKWTEIEFKHAKNKDTQAQIDKEFVVNLDRKGVTN